MVKQSVFSFCLMALAAGLLSGCGGEQAKSDLHSEIADEGAAGQDSLLALEESVSEYRLCYGDVLEIKFFYNTELNQELVVRPDGRITLPRLGDLFVVGYTPQQIDDVITARYSEIIKDPDITVIVKEFAGQVIYVLGEVNVPGGYDLRVNMTALQSIALAGGLTERAKPTSVILVRAVGGGAKAERVNLTKVLKSGSLTDDHVLQPFDVVYVPHHFIDSVDQFMEKYFEGFLPPFNLYLRGYDSVHPRAAVRTR